MAKYRKLGRTSAQRKALLRNQVTALLNNGKIVTTEAKAKEVRKIAEGLIAMAVKEKDNYEMVTVTAKVPVKDKDGKSGKKDISRKLSAKDREKAIAEMTAQMKEAAATLNFELAAALRDKIAALKKSK